MGDNVRKNMHLDQDLLDRARRVLGTRTDTETVAKALDLVVFPEEVLSGIRWLAGSGALRDPFADDAGP